MANNLDAFIPERWAQESLMILEENMVAGLLVHRDFSNEIASYGDVVNTRKPGTFEAKRKSGTSDVTTQDATATNVAVPLDQWLHTSFLLDDASLSKSFKDLVAEFLKPAVSSIASAVDQIVLGTFYQVLDDNVAGNLGTAASKTTLLEARKLLNENKAPNERYLIITPETEADLLSIDNFVTADKVGDEGTALREGSLGSKYGFQIFMSQNAPSIATGNTTVSGTVDNASGYAAGSTTLTVSFTSSLTPGSWCVIDGDNTPQLITSASGSPTTQITISPGLRSAVADDADITVYSPGAINHSGGYSAGYDETLTVDNFTVAPQRGQLITFGTSGTKYSAINTPTTTALDLNIPLSASVADNEVVGIGPAGQYNFAFHRNAVALVSRPLAVPPAQLGAQSFVAQYNGLGLRVTLSYDGSKSSVRVTIDLLCGVKLLDADLACVVLAA